MKKIIVLVGLFFSLLIGNDIGKPFLQTSHSEYITSLAVTANGKFVISASADNTIKLWNINNAKCIRTFQGHTDKVSVVKILSDGNYFLSASADNTIKLWDIRKEEEIRTFYGHEKTINSISIMKGSDFFLSGSKDRTIMLWDIQSGKLVKKFPNKGRVSSVLILPNKKEFLAIDVKNNGVINLWSIENSRRILIEKNKNYYTFMGKLQLTPNEKFIIHFEIESEKKEGDIVIRDANSLERIKILKAHPQMILALTISPDGKTIISSGGHLFKKKDITLKLWDIKSGKCLRTLGDFSHGIYAIAITPDSNFFLSAGSDKQITLWNMKSGNKIKTF